LHKIVNGRMTERPVHWHLHLNLNICS
jgi:hypothetical protein